MAIKKLNISALGISDLLCHNGQTADPRNSYAKQMKAISGKRKKTDADFDQLSRIEWFAGLYVGRTGITKTTEEGEKPCAALVIPSHVLESAFIAGAKKSKRGVMAKSGLFVNDQALLRFNGAPEGDLTEKELTEELGRLYDGGDHHLTVGVRVSTSKVMRTRPKFEKGWEISFGLEFDDAVLTRGDVEEILADTGRLVGLGDWRPKHGRFEVSAITAA